MNGPGRPTRTGSSDADRAVTDLFRTHQLELVRLAMVMVGDLATAEDVVQDAFEHMHRRWHRLRDPGSGLAYARSSVLNGCRTVHRRSAVARRHMPRLAGPSAPGPARSTAAGQPFMPGAADRTARATGQPASASKKAGDRQ